MPPQPCRLKFRIPKSAESQPSFSTGPERVCGSAPPPSIGRGTYQLGVSLGIIVDDVFLLVGERGLNSHGSGFLRCSQNPSPKAWNDPLRFLHPELPSREAG